MNMARWILSVAVLTFCAMPVMAQSTIQTAFNYNLADCGCESDCGCDTCGMGDLFGDCCLGDPCTLKDQLCPCSPWDIGGWAQLGYHSDTTRLSTSPGDLGSFNDVPNGVRLQQAWVYAEKKANARGCCADWGMRADILYGTDAQKTQAFGNPPNSWDFGWNNGSYGWAIPQLYGEVAYGDLSLIHISEPTRH